MSVSIYEYQALCRQIIALNYENAQLRNANAELRRWIEDRTLSIRQIT